MMANDNIGMREMQIWVPAKHNALYLRQANGRQKSPMWPMLSQWHETLTKYLQGNTLCGYCGGYQQETGLLAVGCLFPPTGPL